MDNLELYIKQSSVVLIFLTRSYFLSTNCCRECSRALDLQKPMIVLHDIAGHSLAEIEAECTEPAMKTAIFDDPAAIVPVRFPAYEFGLCALPSCCQC